MLTGEQVNLAWFGPVSKEESLRALRLKHERVWRTPIRHFRRVHMCATGSTTLLLVLVAESAKIEVHGKRKSFFVSHIFAGLLAFER